MKTSVVTFYNGEDKFNGNLLKLGDELTIICESKESLDNIHRLIEGEHFKIDVIVSDIKENFKEMIQNTSNKSGMTFEDSYDTIKSLLIPYYVLLGIENKTINNDLIIYSPFSSIKNIEDLEFSDYIYIDILKQVEGDDLDIINQNIQDYIGSEFIVTNKGLWKLLIEMVSDINDELGRNSIHWKLPTILLILSILQKNTFKNINE